MMPYLSGEDSSLFFLMLNIMIGKHGPIITLPQANRTWSPQDAGLHANMFGKRLQEIMELTIGNNEMPKKIC